MGNTRSQSHRDSTTMEFTIQTLARCDVGFRPKHDRAIFVQQAGPARDDTTGASQSTVTTNPKCSFPGDVSLQVTVPLGPLMSWRRSLTPPAPPQDSHPPGRRHHQRQLEQNACWTATSPLIAVCPFFSLPHRSTTVARRPCRCLGLLLPA